MAADLPDLTTFLLATGARIGEALGLLWSEVDLELRQVSITGQVIRIAGEGLIRAPTQSAAGKRVLTLPGWCVDMLTARKTLGVRTDEPVFCDALGGFRDPSNVRRDLRRARAPRGSQSRQDLGASLARARRSAAQSRSEVAEALGWPRTRLELVESGRVRLERKDAVTLMERYGVSGAARRELLAMADEAAKAADADALSWITSHTFRKTNATILDDAGLSARQIADQLGHARPSLTQDVYMGRRARNSAAAAALEGAHRNRPSESKVDHYVDQSRGRPKGPTR